MSQAEDLLNSLSVESEGITYYEIDPTTRTINIPSDFLLGVESDEKSNRVYFTCPKVVGDNFDFTTSQVRVNYQNANGEKGQYDVDDIVESNTNTGFVEFSWLLDREVTKYKGDISFNICAIKTTSNKITNEWNTIPATGKSLQGLEVTDAVATYLSHIKGDSFISILSITDATGNAYNPAEDDSIIFTLKNSSDTLIITKTIQNDTLKLVLNPEDTSDLEVGDYIYNVKLTKSTGEVYTVIPNSIFTLTN